MTPAAANTVKNLKFCETICWLRNVSSLTKMTEAKDVSLIMALVPLAMHGRMARIACGRMMRLGVRDGPIPGEDAPTARVRVAGKTPPRLSSSPERASGG